MASRIQKIYVFKKGLNFASCSCFASCIMKKTFFFHAGKKRRFFLFSPWNYLLLHSAAEQFEFAVSFKGARFEIYKKQSIILGAAIENYFGSICLEVNCQACNFTGHIFLTCFKKFLKILKVGKIFQCVTSFYQYFFVRDKSCCYKTNSDNSYN